MPQHGRISNVTKKKMITTMKRKRSTRASWFCIPLAMVFLHHGGMILDIAYALSSSSAHLWLSSPFSSKLFSSFSLKVESSILRRKKTQLNSSSVGWSKNPRKKTKKKGVRNSKNITNEPSKQKSSSRRRRRSNDEGNGPNKQSSHNRDSNSSSSTPQKRQRQNRQQQKQQPVSQQPRRQKQQSTSQQQQNLTKPSSMGEAITRCRYPKDYLSVIDEFVWLPTDTDLPPHLQKQAIHHERRRRWAGQLLDGLGSSFSSCYGDGESGWREMEEDSLQEMGRCWWSDARLGRAILAAVLPFNDGASDKAPVERVDKEGRWISDAIRGLHSLSGYVPPPNSLEYIHTDVLDGVQKLIASADKLANEMKLHDAVEIRWAIRGLVSRFPGESMHDVMRNDDILQSSSSPLPPTITPILDRRVSSLPFDILPLCLDWRYDMNDDKVEHFHNAIPFRFDTITTRTGSSVVERRGTAWLSEPGIGALAYSGKLMEPTSPLPIEVVDVMLAIENECSDLLGLDPFAPEEFTDETNYKDHNLGRRPSFFDCALCNYYPDGDAACKFHTDPEHGSHWHRTTCVVSCGSPRKFAFRPIPGLNTWSKWEKPNAKGISGVDDDATAPAVLRLFPGDVVVMKDECNDVFHHAVYAAEGTDDENGARVSLVLKRSLDRGGGQRGHGLAGEGRRSRRRQRRE